MECGCPTRQTAAETGPYGTSCDAAKLVDRGKIARRTKSRKSRVAACPELHSIRFSFLSANGS